MLRKGFCALVMVVLCITLVSAETIKGRITKISGDSVSVVVGKDKEAKSYPIAKDATFSQMGKKDDKEVKEKIEGGVKASVFQKIGDKGISAMIVTDDTTKSVKEVILSVKKDKK